MAFRSVVSLPLTRRELEVADLVREGLTNREIAARLFLSERTVEGHVAQICGKLGVRSRLQIATWVLEQEDRQPSSPPAPAVVSRRRPRALIWAAIALVATLALGGALVVAVGLQSPKPPRPPLISTYQAGLMQPAGVVVDPARGVVYIADSGNDSVRVLASDGSSQTLTGKEKEFGLPMKHPTGLAVDRAGRLYIADTGNHRVLEFNNYYLTVLAGTGQAGFSGDGAAAAAAQLDSPEAVTVDGSGNLYIADTGNNRIRVVDAASGTIATVAGGGQADPFTGDYLGLYPLTIRLHQPAGLAVNRAGDLFVADTRAHEIYEIPRAAQGSFGPIRRFVGTGMRGHSGDGGPGVRAQISEPRGMAIDRQGSLYFADSGNNRAARIDTHGVISTLAGSGTLNFGGDGGPAPLAGLAFPAAVSTDSSGQVYIADTGNSRVRLVRVGSGPGQASEPALARPSFPPGSYMAQIQAQGKLVAFVRSTFPFLAYRNPRTGRFEGFEIDMIRAVARAIFGRDDDSVIEFMPLAPAKRVPTLQSGAANIGDATWFAESNPLKAKVDLADPILRTVDLVLVRRGDPIRSFGDLAGKTICVVPIPAADLPTEIRHAQPQIGGLVQGTRDECLAALHNGRAVAIYGHSPDTMALAAADPDLTFTTALLTPRLWGWAVPKGHPEFVQFLNGLVGQLQADGRWNAAARKWLNGYDDTFNPQIK